ncbi:MAG: hypothetical protein BWY85_01221 [Firmicutes bacterium ADurb.Bin506]|nr:MAG: hypothetical protein BWY85_01221 [Firmicutes bacterium ADurb.Bin506]
MAKGFCPAMLITVADVCTYSSSTALSRLCGRPDPATSRLTEFSGPTEITPATSPSASMRPASAGSGVTVRISSLSVPGSDSAFSIVRNGTFVS